MQFLCHYYQQLYLHLLNFCLIVIFNIPFVNSERNTVGLGNARPERRHVPAHQGSVGLWPPAGRTHAGRFHRGRWADQAEDQRFVHQRNVYTIHAISALALATVFLRSCSGNNAKARFHLWCGEFAVWCSMRVSLMQTVRVRHKTLWSPMRLTDTARGSLKRPR